MKIKNKAVLGRSALICTTLIWGTSFVVLKSALDSITPLWVLAIRFGGAALMMLAASIPLLKKLDKQYLKGGTIMGACLAAAYTVQTYGLMYTTPGKNAFLTATYCILVPFLYWIIFGKKPDKYNIGAALICLVGMGFVCLNKDLSVNKGDLLTVCCGLFYGLHIIVTSRHVEGKSPLLLTMIQFAVAAILCLAFALMLEPKPQNIPSGSWLSIAYLTFMCTGVCFFLQTVGQKFTPPSAAAVIMTLESVFGTALSVAMGQEMMTFNIGLGFVLIFCAILISETKLSFLKKKR
ncbi:MAG: DMT family transporter [Firmicutes bacterium]|nr:DMT family transporter [Bacillota bacterium]